jgi:site-specific recombinase XerD
MQNEMTEYLERVRQTKAANTHATYKQSLDLFAKTCTKDVLSIQNDDLQRFAQERRAAGDGQRTVHNRFLHVVIGLRAVGNRNLPGRSAFPRKTERLPEQYSGTELTKLLVAATPEEKLLVEMFLCSGMRNKEVANLQVADLDFESSVIRIRVKENWQPKGGKEREVALPQWLTKKLAARCVGKKPEDLLFANREGTVDRNLLRVVKRVAVRAGLKGRVDVHKFRSTSICQRLRSGWSLQDTMSAAGHSDLATVKRYLAVASRDQMQQMSEKAFAQGG